MTRKLTIFQANVRKTQGYHDTALATAWERKFDIVLIQEPFFNGKDSETPRPRTNPGFIAFTPIDTYEEGLPDVLTYVRIRPGLQATQITLPNPSRGTLWIKIRGITIANIYNRTNPQCNLPALLSPIDIPEKFLSAGDFNAHHWDWDRQKGIKANACGVHTFVMKLARTFADLTPP